MPLSFASYTHKTLTANPPISPASIWKFSDDEWPTIGCPMTPLASKFWDAGLPPLEVNAVQGGSAVWASAIPTRTIVIVNEDIRAT